MDVDLADLIYGDNLQFGFYDSIRFRKVMYLAKHVPSTYKFPNRKRRASDLLAATFKTYESTAEDLVSRQASVFGYSIMSDGMTHFHHPLINILAQTAVQGSPNLAKVVDCSYGLDGARVF